MATAPGRPDLRAPFVLNVSRLGRRPGEMMDLAESVTAPSRIGLDLIAIPAGSPVQLDLRLQSVSEGVLITGTVSAPVAGECARCLVAVHDAVQIELTELFAYADSTTEATTEADEVGHVVGHTVDLEQHIVDAVGLALPFAPLCADDCPGLCPSCGLRLADLPDGGAAHTHDVIDPRWAKLAALLPDPDAGDPAPGAAG